MAGTTRGTLSVQIKRASNLTTTDGTEQLDHYVECSLLPDTSGKRKTAVKSLTSPSWGETLLFEKVTLEEIAAGRVLEVTVLNFNQDNGPKFIGGLRIGPRPRRTSQDKEWMDSQKEEAEHWETMLSHPGEWAEQWHTLRRNMQPRKIDFATAADNEFRKIATNPSSGSPHRSSGRPPLPPSSSKQPPIQRSSPVVGTTLLSGHSLIRTL